MTAPRKNTDFVNAPVLFRLPDLRGWQAAGQPECAPAESAHAPIDAAYAACPLRPEGDVADQPEIRSYPAQQAVHRHDLNRAKSASAEMPPAFTQELVSESPVSRRPEIIANRSVILLTMTVVACGAWLAGRHTSPQPSRETAVPGDIAAQTPTSDTARTQVADALKVAVRSKPAPTSANLPERQSHYRDQDSFATDGSDFHLADDVTVVAKESVESTSAAASASQQQTPATQSGDGSTSIAARAEADEPDDPNQVFAALSFGALAPPANHPAPQTSESDSEQLASSRPQATVRGATSNDSELDLDSESAAAAPPQDASQTLATGLASDTADLPLSDPVVSANSEADQAAPSQKSSPKLRRVLSSTPNDIPDWSVYFPGASGPVRAASAEGLSQPADGSAQTSSRQAFYLDSDAPF